VSIETRASRGNSASPFSLSKEKKGKKKRKKKEKEKKNSHQGNELTGISRLSDHARVEERKKKTRGNLGNAR